MDHIILIPHNFCGPGIAGEFFHEGNGCAVFQFHPMAFAFVDLHLVGVAAWVL